MQRYFIIKSFLLFFLISSANQVYAASTKEQLAAIAQRLDQIERLIHSQGLLDLLQQTELLQQELSQLRGEMEVQNHSLAEIKRRQRDLYNDIDRRIQRVENSSTAVQVTVETEPDTSVVDASSPPLETLRPTRAEESNAGTQQSDSSLTVELVNQAPQSSPQVQDSGTVPDTTVASMPDTPAGLTVESDPVQARAEYQSAFKLLKQSLYDQAIEAFREFLGKHPNSEYSDNAQYWLGEAYYVNRQFELALEEYKKLVVTYPESQKLTHSLLKIGYSYQELDQVNEAKAQLEALIQNYPGTTAARLAEDRLKKINSIQPQASTSDS